MTALSANTARKRKSLQLAEHDSRAAKTSATVYQGSLVSVVESTGRAKAAAAAAGETFLGVSEHQATGNTSGTTSVRFLYGHAELLAAATALTKSFIGCNVAVSDDNTVTTVAGAGTAGVQVRVGELLDVPSANKAWVWIRHFSQKDAP